MAEALRYPPLPPGTPHLMPFEAEPFNGDTFLEAEVLRLKAKHGLKTAVETGTCLGSSTMFLAEHFDQVTTFEISEQYRRIALKRMQNHPTIERTVFKWCSSVELGEYLQCWAEREQPYFFFLDAHWEKSCPLIEELDGITKSQIRPCIVIHDFQVPGTDFGFDAWNDQPFTLEWVTPHLDRIYGESGWTHNYPTQVAGAMRGWISIEPA